MRDRILHKSFTGGVISSEMLARIDDAKYQNGAEILDNFIVRPQGGAENRAGFALVAEVKNSNKLTRIIPFIYSQGNANIIEFGEGYFRFHSNGKVVLDTVGNPYEVVNTYKEDELFEVDFAQSKNVLTLVHRNHKPAILLKKANATWTFSDVLFDNAIQPPANVSVTVKTTDNQAGSRELMNYVVVAVDSDEIKQSKPSEVASGTNNIYSTGATNTVTWTASPNALRYNVYKERGGLYGYIGSTDTTTLIDNNIAPDLSITPALYKDKNFGRNAGDYPSTVSYGNQRRIFAGTKNNDETVWLTRTGTDSDLSYSIPTQLTDRIKLKLSSKETNAIRHIVFLNDLIVLTESAEWQINTAGGELEAKPNSYNGSSYVQPVVVSNSIVYVTNRGSYLRDLHFDWRSKGFVSEHLSIRATHLFEKKTINDIAYSKYPEQLVWSVSSDGTLIVLSYVPEEEIIAFSTLKTQGAFESCTVVPELDEDFLYAVVKRKINGVTKRFIERKASRLKKTDERDYFFVDCGLTYDGRNITNTTLTLKVVDAVNNIYSITSSSSFFSSVNPVGSRIVIDQHKFIMTEVVTGTEAKAYPETSQSITHLLNIPTLKWELTGIHFGGLSHLEGMIVSILADGATHKPTEVKNGKIKLERSASVVHVGLGYNCDLKTLPLVVEDEKSGSGRPKNINKIWLRVLRSSPLLAGNSFDNLTEIKFKNETRKNPLLVSELLEAKIKSHWLFNGQVCVRQESPLPLSVSGITLDVSLGG